MSTRYFICASLALAAASGAHGLGYELHGTLVQEEFPRDGRTARVDWRAFSVYVQGCQWLVRTEDMQPGLTPSIREVASTNGQEVFDLYQPGVALEVTSVPASNAAKGPLSASATNAPARKQTPAKSHCQVTVVSNTVPTGCNGLALFASHLWQMFASRCYFEGRTNREVTPVYDINACVLHDKGYTQEADWALSGLEPHLPLWVSYMNTRGWLTRKTNGTRGFVGLGRPFDQGFTNALYTVTGMTNVGGLQLPTGFSYERFVPAAGARSKASLQRVARATAVVTNFIAECSRTNLLPAHPAIGVIVDRRLAHAQPAIAAMVYSASQGRWLTVEEAKVVHEARLRRMTPRRLSPVAVALFALALLSPIVVVLVRSRRARKP